MTNREKKAWLNRASAAEEYLHELQTSYQELFEAATRVTANLSGDTGSGTPNPHKFDKLAEYSDTIAEAVDELAEIRQEVVEAINTLPKVHMRRIMFLRYVKGMKWDDVIETVNYSPSQVYRIHGNALLKLNITKHASK